MPESAPDYYFPPGRSVARRVHAERAVGVLYGQRALLLGALEPLTYVGTMQSTKSDRWPFLRLARTARIHEAVLLGTREEADRALESVSRLHRQVAGRLPEAAGGYPVGTPYSALDPQLMLWTLAVIADSARVIYETLVRPLSADERERLWQDYVLFGELFGLPREAIPLSFAEFSAWLAERMGAPDLRPTPHALEMAPLIAFKHPLPLAARPGLHANNLLIKGTLSTEVRETFAIHWTPAHQVAFRTLIASHRRAHRFLPGRLKQGRNDVFFDLIIRAERQRGGTETPPFAALA